MLSYITIKQCENGYIITPYEYDEDNKVQEETSILCYGEHDEDEQGALKSLLTSVASHFGHDYDKWAKDNLRISFDLVGHKVSDQDTIGSEEKF